MDSSKLVEFTETSWTSEKLDIKTIPLELNRRKSIENAEMAAIWYIIIFYIYIGAYGLNDMLCLIDVGLTMSE